MRFGGPGRNAAMSRPLQEKAIVIAFVLTAWGVAMAPPALAQEGAGQVALPEGAPPEINGGSLYSGPYEVTKDGDLIYGGDVRYGCEDLPRFAALAEQDPEGAGGESEDAFLKDAIGLCAEAGFPPEGATSPAAPAVPSVDALPTTGGPTLTPAPSLVVAAVAALAARLALHAGHQPGAPASKDREESSTRRRTRTLCSLLVSPAKLR